jgi:hypothetical protein
MHETGSWVILRCSVKFDPCVKFVSECRVGSSNSILSVVIEARVWYYGNRYRYIAVAYGVRIRSNK